MKNVGELKKDDQSNRKKNGNLLKGFKNKLGRITTSKLQEQLQTATTELETAEKELAPIDQKLEKTKNNITTAQKKLQAAKATLETAENKVQTKIKTVDLKFNQIKNQAERTSERETLNASNKLKAAIKSADEEMREIKEQIEKIILDAEKKAETEAQAKAAAEIDTVKTETEEQVAKAILAKTNAIEKLQRKHKPVPQTNDASQTTATKPTILKGWADAWRKRKSSSELATGEQVFLAKENARKALDAITAKTNHDIAEAKATATATARQKIMAEKKQEVDAAEARKNTKIDEAEKINNDEIAKATLKKENAIKNAQSQYDLTIQTIRETSAAEINTATQAIETIKLVLVKEEAELEQQTIAQTAAKERVKKATEKKQAAQEALNQRTREQTQQNKEPEPSTVLAAEGKNKPLETSDTASTINTQQPTKEKFPAPEQNPIQFSDSGSDSGESEYEEEEEEENNFSKTFNRTSESSGLGEVKKQSQPSSKSDVHQARYPTSTGIEKTDQSTGEDVPKTVTSYFSLQLFFVMGEKLKNPKTIRAALVLFLISAAVLLALTYGVSASPFLAAWITAPLAAQIAVGVFSGLMLTASVYGALARNNFFRSAPKPVDVSLPATQQGFSNLSLGMTNGGQGS